MGKGSTPRPRSVTHKTFSENYDRIFGKKTNKPVEPDEGKAGKPNQDDESAQEAPKGLPS